MLKGNYPTGVLQRPGDEGDFNHIKRIAGDEPLGRTCADVLSDIVSRLTCVLTELHSTVQLITKMYAKACGFKQVRKTPASRPRNAPSPLGVAR